MNQRLLTILMIALLVSAVAAVFVYRQVTGRMVALENQATQKIVVAARDLDVGALIKAGDVRIGDWAGDAPKGSSQKTEPIVGRAVVSAMYQGEPVLESRLAPTGSAGGFASTIPPGMRAVAVKVNEVVGVAGFVTPGMRVDVLISGIPPGGSPSAGPKVKTVLQNIQVLSAGANFQTGANSSNLQVPVVNLLVTPEQAEVLSLASNETRIQLVLRNPADTAVTQPPGTVMSSLFSGKEKEAPAPAPVARYVPPPPPVTKSEAPPPPPPPTFYSVEVLNGSTRSEAKFVKPAEQK